MTILNCEYAVLIRQVVRACVAMTSKKEAPYGQLLELEIFHEDKEHYALAHNDIAARNIMFGDREPDVPERRCFLTLFLLYLSQAAQLKDPPG